MKATVRVAPATAAFFAASFLTRSCAAAAAAAAAAAPQTGMDGHRDLGDEDEPYVDYGCTVVLYGARRPMLTEKEMKRFDKSFEKCTVQIAEYQGLEKPKLEFVSVVGQELNDSGRRLLGGGRKERRRLVSTNQVSLNSRCKGCNSTSFPSDRRLEGEEAEVGYPHVDRIMAAFDECMLNELTRDVDANDHELAAFHLLQDVSTSCSIVVLNDQIFDVLADGANDTTADATCVCDTIIHGATAPMLSEREMARFDRCWIEEYNGFHSIDPTKGLIVSSEIVKQQPRGETNIARRLGGGANQVLTRKATCRVSCEDEVLATRKLMANPHGRELEINIETFDDRLRNCLVSSIDAKTNATYPAFAGELTVETKCDEPIPTVQEVESQQAQARSAFELVQDSEKEEFEQEWRREEDRLKLAEVQHKAKKDKFAFKQKVKEYEFKQYQAYMAEVASQQMKSSCVRPMQRWGCGDVMDMLPNNFIWVKEAKALSVKVEIQQGIGIDYVTGLCANVDREEQYYVHFVKENEDDGSVEHVCSVESEKCGKIKSYESKYCYWDESESIMAADFEVLFPIAVLLREESEVIGGPEDNNEEVCLNARDRARERQDYCYLKYKVDCNCQAIPP